MVKKRERKPSVKQFIESSSVEAKPDAMEEDAPRKYKTIGLQFNKFEYDRLDAAAKKTKRSKNSIIREGLNEIINQLLKD